MNQIIFTGRLTDEPKVTYSAGNEPVAHATFNFAVPDMSMRRDEQGNYPTDFFRCSCWGKLAETIEKHCVKGTKLLIVGIKPINKNKFIVIISPFMLKKRSN